MNVIPGGGVKAVLQAFGISDSYVTLFAGTGDGGGIPSIRYVKLQGFLQWPTCSGSA